MNFLFFIYLIGVLFAIYSDFKKREIDDSVNLFIFSSGVLYLLLNYQFIEDLLSFIIFSITFLFFMKSLFYHSNESLADTRDNWTKIYQDFLKPSGLIFIFISLLLILYNFKVGSYALIFSIILLFSLWWGLLFYQLHIFAGGDVKLLCAFSPLFFSGFLMSSFYNLLIFSFLLLLAGSAYSLSFSLFLFFKDFKKIFEVMFREIKKKYNIVFLGIGILFLISGFLEKVFIFLSIYTFIFILLFCFAKSLEEVSMKKYIRTSELREGDWLFSDVKIGKKLFKKSWSGLSKEEISYMKKFNKKVFIKDGIPYAPSFLFALILFEFRDYLAGIIFS